MGAVVEPGLDLLVQAEGWLDSVRISKSPNTFVQRLVAAFCLGGSEDWAAGALTKLVPEARDRGLADEDALNALSADTWAHWSEAVLDLGDPGFRAPFEAEIGRAHV